MSRLRRNGLKSMPTREGIFHGAESREEQTGWLNSSRERFFGSIGICRRFRDITPQGVRSIWDVKYGVGRRDFNSTSIVHFGLALLYMDVGIGVRMQEASHFRGREFGSSGTMSREEKLNH